MARRVRPRSQDDLATTNTVPFYSGGFWSPFPACDGSTALRYFESRSPDFLVLRRTTANRPYRTEWLDGGIPASRAQAIYKRRTPTGDEITIYRWQRP
jgi:hypothetical protein